MVKDDACRQNPLRRWFGECAARTCLRVALCDEFSEIIDFPPRGIHRFLELGEVTLQVLACGRATEQRLRQVEEARGV